MTFSCTITTISWTRTTNSAHGADRLRLIFACSSSTAWTSARQSTCGVAESFPKVDCRRSNCGKRRTVLRQRSDARRANLRVASGSIDGSHNYLRAGRSEQDERCRHVCVSEWRGRRLIRRREQVLRTNDAMLFGCSHAASMAAQTATSCSCACACFARTAGRRSGDVTGR